MQRSHLIIAASVLLAAVVIASILAFPLFSPKPAGSSKNLQIEWQQFLPGITGKEIIQTSDGGYLALGTTASIQEIDNYSGPIFVNEQPILVKTDNLGKVQWQKTFQVLGLTPTLSNIAQTEDGGYAVVGGITNASTYNNPFSRFCLIKLDNKGDVNWTQTYTGPSDANNVAFNSILQASDGGYTLFGTWSRYWDYHGLRTGYLVKTDEAGNAYFSKGVDTGPASSLVQTSDGYIFFTTQNAIGGGQKFMLVKTDLNGDTLWSVRYQGIGSSSYENCGIPTSDGGYLLGGRVTGTDRGWLVKTNSERKMLWNQTYPNVMEIKSVTQADDNSYVISGVANATEFSYAKGTAMVAWFAKIDSLGNIEAEFNAGPVELKHGTAPSSVIQTSDGGFICVGTWDQTYQASSSQRFWIAKISL